MWMVNRSMEYDLRAVRENVSKARLLELEDVVVISHYSFSAVAQQQTTFEQLLLLSCHVMMPLVQTLSPSFLFWYYHLVTNITYIRFCLLHKMTTKYFHPLYKYEPQKYLPDYLRPYLQLHSPRPSVTLWLYFSIILFNLILYSPLYTWINIPQLHFINMEPMASQVRKHYSQKNQQAHLGRALSHAFKKTAKNHS